MPTSSWRASRDARVREAFPNTNYGEEHFLAVQSASGGNTQNSELGFPGLPELGSVIVSATLRVWLKGTGWSSGGPHDITVRRITESWKESQITWNTKPAPSATEATATVATGVDGQSVDIDLTTLVSNVMTGSLYFGLILGTTTGTTGRSLYSSEASDPMLRPLLIVEYSDLPQSPADLSPSGGLNISLAKPVFSWKFRDPNGDQQASFQVQLKATSGVQADGSFASPEYDSGWIASTSEEFDSNLSGTGGAIPTFVAAGTVASGTGAVTPGLPAGVVKDDVLWLACESEAVDPAPAAPDGYTPAGPSIVGGNTRLTVFYRRATNVEVAPTVADVGDHLLARMVATRGNALTGNPWELFVSSIEGTSDTSGSATGLTTTAANALVLVFATSDFDAGADDTAGYSAWTNASLANLTERTDNRAAAGSGGTLAITTGDKATAGAVSATTYTLANAGTKSHLVLALQPTGAYGGTWAGITDGNTRYWIVRAKDEQGNISPWADPQGFTRSGKGAFTISSPTTGGTVEETTPPIITSLATRSQESISYLLEQWNAADNEWIEVWSQGKRAAPTTPGSNYSFGVPAGKITLASNNYRLTVRSWDNLDRDACPGDPAYVQAQSTFTFVRSATPSAVTVLTAAQEANGGPGVVLTFNRAVGQAAPDYFALVVDGERVLDRIDPADIIVGGSPIVFNLVWYGAEPYGSVTYEVEAVTVVSGVLKHSQGNDTEAFTSRPSGIWLVDDNDAPYAPGAPPRRVRLTGTASPSLGISESGATYKPVGRRDPVTIIDAIGGYEGTVSGRINTSDPLESGVSSIANLRWMKRPRNVGRRFRLLAGGLSIPVELGVVDLFAPIGDAGQVRGYDVSFEVAQVGDFRETR
jgi:hypothetical protein